MERPSTSKARGVCRFFNTSRGCREATKCKFLHDHPTLTPFDQAKTCKFYAAGFCSRGDKCWFKHVKPVVPATTSEPVVVSPDEVDETCSICYEIPTIFGLLTGCNHIFCINCLRDWRSPSGKSEDLISSQSIKKCPLCREPSRYCVPSSIFYAQGSSEKDHAIDMYRASMARVPCKYFKPTARRPYCPFGDECFYQHANADGTRHTLGYGLNANRRRRHGADVLLTFEQQLLGLEDLFRGAQNPTQDLQTTMTYIRNGLPGVTNSIERDGSDVEAARELGDMANRLVASLTRVIGMRERPRRNRGAARTVPRDNHNEHDSITPSESASQAGVNLSRPGSPSATDGAIAAGPADANAASDRLHMVWDMVSDGPLHTFPPLPLATTDVDVGAEARVAELEHAILRHNIEQLRLNDEVTATAIRDVGGPPAASTSRPSRFSTTVAGRTGHASAPGSPEAPLERRLQQGWRPYSALEQISATSGDNMPELVPLSDSDSEVESSSDGNDEASLAPEEDNPSFNDLLLQEALAFMSAHPSMLFQLHDGHQDSDSDDEGPPPLEPIPAPSSALSAPPVLQRDDVQVMTAAVYAAHARAEALNARTDVLIAQADAMLHSRADSDQVGPDST